MKAKISSGLLVTMVILALHMDSSVYGQNWPMINFNKERTSWVSGETVLHPPLQQKNEIPVKSTGDYIRLNYLTFFDNLLALAVGRDPNTLEVVDIVSGDTLWTFEVADSEGAMSFVCAQNDSMIFAGGQRGWGLFALNAITGAQKWSKPVGNLYARSIILDNEFAYILGDSLYCLSIADGSTVWSKNISFQSTPAVDDKYVYVVGNYKAQVFDKLSGELEWWRPVSERTTGGTVVDNDCFYTQSNDTIFAYNKESWDEKWIYVSPGDTIQSEAQNSIAITDNRLCFTIKGNSEGDGELVTLNKETGGFIWAHSFPEDYMFAPTIANGVVYIIPYPEAALYGFNLENGTQLFYDDSFSYTGQAIVANHQLFVVTRYSVVVFGNSETSLEDSENSDLSAFELMQNFPNPFSTMTRIRFNLPQSAFADLKVYNSLGEEICTLVREERAPGLHSIDFDGTHLPGGLYFYKLDAGSFETTRQMVVIK
ncbi:MAG: PQQ-binding-like beta-propeller repeat protein [Bacteroidales bacterium]|nr:PQQ-binding-like beta-propeller repeat protein [Bacteroidales bacterium]